VKDFEFSRDTIEQAWAAGLDDVRRSVVAWDEIKPEGVPGVRVYRPTEALPAPRETRTSLARALMRGARNS
jgi:hypothetical protein